MQFALTKASGYYWTMLRPDDPFPRHLDCDTRLDSLGDDEWHCPECDLSGGLLRPTAPNQSSPFLGTVQEAASWWLASELALRHPELRVYRVFPKPGVSNVLMVVPSTHTPQKSPGPVLFLNAVPGGRIHLLQRNDGIEPAGGPWLWDEALTAHDDSESLIERMEHASGLGAPEHRPPSNEAAVYALIARLTALSMFDDEPLSIDNSTMDGWGPPEFPAWWEDLKMRESELTQPRPNDLAGNPGYRFWRIERSDFALTIETSTGTLWADEYDPEELKRSEYDTGAYLLATELFPPGNRAAIQIAREMGEP